MNTSAGSPLPYTWYCTCTPSGVMAMRGAPSGGSWLAAGAAPACGAEASSFWLQPNRARASTTTALGATPGLRMDATLGYPRGLSEPRHVFADGHRRSQARALDAQQVHQAGDAVLGRAFDAEVGLWLARTMQLRADTGVVGHQRAVGETRPVAAHGVVEQR